MIHAIKLFFSKPTEVEADDDRDTIDDNDIESDVHGVIVTNVNNFIVSSACDDSCQAG